MLNYIGCSGAFWGAVTTAGSSSSPKRSIRFVFYTGFGGWEGWEGY